MPTRWIAFCADSGRQRRTDKKYLLFDPYYLPGFHQNYDSLGVHLATNESTPTEWEMGDRVYPHLHAIIAWHNII